MNIVLKRAGGTYANDCIHIEEIEKFINVQDCGRNAHARAHNRNFFAFIHTGVTVHVSDVIEEYRIFKIMFCNIFSTQRIARHKYNFGNVRSFF